MDGCGTAYDSGRGLRDDEEGYGGGRGEFNCEVTIRSRAPFGARDLRVLPVLFSRLLAKRL